MKNKEAILAFGANLRRIRNEKGYSQQQLADDAGMSKMTIFKIESGKMNCSIDIYFTLCKTLEIEPEELIVNVLK